MSFSFAMAQKTDPLLTSIRDTLGMEYLKDLGIDGTLNTTRLKSHKQSEDYIKISKSVAALLSNSPVPPFVGSNSWVIGPQKAKNGKVIFANDPHIGFSQPGTWYEAHIVVPDYEMYGYYLAGTPFPLLGHNRDYAYGLTMFENDDIDLFSENQNPADENQYQTQQGWTNYGISEKTIVVKDSLDVKLKIKTSKHGPVMNGILEGLQHKKPVSLSWIYTQQPLRILEAVYGLSHAGGIGDFHQKVGLIAAPGLNVMYGDAKNNIAWFASGKLYKLDKSVNPNFILDGANGIDDQKEFIDFSKNPSAVNPSWNYVYSANNQPEAINGYLYPGYYLPEDRARRIDQLLAVKNNWDKESAAGMITDNVSAVTPDVVKIFVLEVSAEKLSPNEKVALQILKSWSGSNNYDDIAPTIYNKCITRFLENTFKDEIGEERFRLFNSTHLLKQIIAPTIKNQHSVWWDNAGTQQRENRTVILQKSFREAVGALEKQLGTDINSWTWNRVHTVEHQHPFGTIAALRPYFNVGPFAIDGSNEVINNTFFEFSDNGEYKAKGGSSTRRIIDFSDIENGLSILPTGQSGNFLSRHYDDQAAMYNAGKFRKMKLNKAEIMKTSTKLVFRPKPGGKPK
jgi:penicillin G amidase